MGDLVVQGDGPRSDPAQEVALPGTRSTALPVHALKAERERIEWSLLVLLDGAMIFAGFAIAYIVRYVLNFPRDVLGFQKFAAFGPTIALLIAATLVLLVAKGLYRQPRNVGWLIQLSIIFSSVLTATAITIIATFISGAPSYSRLIFVFAFVAIVATLGLGRWLVTRIRRRRWARGQDLERVLVVGGTGLARRVMVSLQHRMTLGYDLVGYVADQTAGGDDSDKTELPVPHLGVIERLPQEVARRRVERVIIALPFWENHRLPEVVETCHQLGVPFQVVPDFYELSFDRMAVQESGGVPLIELRENVIRGWNYVLKRALDVSLVLLALPVWGLLALIVMLIVRLDSSGDIIFRQTRIGRNGRPFEFLKFRTMVPNAEELKASLLEQNEGSGPMFKIRRDPRLTRVGRWLRRTSLDELPQFWNVLRGEMSLVGPRPAVPEEVAQYEPWQRRRFEVTPGVTGPWQATGRSDMTFDEMVRLDIYYAEHWSIGMDIRIMLQTIPAILSARGAY